MQPKKNSPTQTFVDCATDMLLSGLSHRQAQVKYESLSDRDIRFCRRWLKSDPEQFTAQIVAGLRIAQARLLGLLIEKAGKITPGQLPLAFAIITDKLGLMEGKPSAIVENRTLRVAGKEMGFEQIQALFDRQKKPTDSTIVNRDASLEVETTEVQPDPYPQRPEAVAEPSLRGHP